MSDQFFDKPILNSPYAEPLRHWELTADGQPTQKIIESRRRAEFISPIPKPRKKAANKQLKIGIEDSTGLSDEKTEYDPTSIINRVRNAVSDWRSIPNPQDWKVTPETARILKHWREHKFSAIRPFFCQIEAAETAIWLTEVAPTQAIGRNILEHLKTSNQEANPGLSRMALKLATGAGKTTVMAMIIAWQTVNAVQYKKRYFTRSFLIITPGITIRDRLRVLQPSDPDSYYKRMELLPADMMEEIQKAKIVITNYHAFKLRDTIDISKGGRALLEGRTGEPLKTLETEGAMVRRVMPQLIGMKNILAINDEAHHCYRERQPGADEVDPDADLKGDEKDEASKNREAARLWISGLEAVNRVLGLNGVVDLSATPFFLKGSGYVEGTLFHWTVSDFSLMDAIESGIVKLPRVPVADNIPGAEVPMFRELWEHVRKDMPKKGRSANAKSEGVLLAKKQEPDPEMLPVKLQTALDALFGHYKQTFNLWKEAGLKVPPCFIIVCNNTTASKLVYDYVSGYEIEHEDGSVTTRPGKLDLFNNYDPNGNQLGRPNTLLIDSEQLESGEALDVKFRGMAKAEIDRFRHDIMERTGNREQAENISDQDLLREVMNTVGKPGRLGESIRCVVSVSMLTEGWDTNTVTHVLGVRAFGTQLLCEQVIGRALRRQSYQLNSEGLFSVEYADILGIPFNFTAKPVPVKPLLPALSTQVKAMNPEREHLEIRFPRVTGYTVSLPDDRLEAVFNEESILVLTPDIVGATETRNSGIIGEHADLTLTTLANVRPSQVIFELTSYLLNSRYKDANGMPEMSLFGQLKRICSHWIENCLQCRGGTVAVQLKYKYIAEMAAERIQAGIVRNHMGKNKVKVITDPYNPIGSTRHVAFATSQPVYETDSRKCHLNYLVTDSDWEAEFCRIAEKLPQVAGYVKNHNLGFEVPYVMGGEPHKYIPDFILKVDDGHGPNNLLHLVLEVKGFRAEDAKIKKLTMETYWIPGVNHAGIFGRWAFLELTEVYTMETIFAGKLAQQLTAFINTVTQTNRQLI